MMTETQERFLREVLARVDAARVAECHLFPPIRRGTVETGVAVLALRVDAPPAVALVVADDVAAVATDDAEVPVDAVSPSDYELAPDLGMPIDGDALAIAAAREEAPDLDAPVDGDMLTIAAAEGTAPDVDAPVDGDALTIAAAAEGAAAPVMVDDLGALLEDSPYAPVPAPVEATLVEPVIEPRALIVTASYRSVIKGPDRGQWKLEIIEQGEAPLSAVEVVLRGVRQRSTEPADPESVPLTLLAQLLAPTPAAPVAPPAALAPPAPVSVPVAAAAAA
ncbi:MAG: hypothetical protein MUF40_01330 [Gemmatimonadaceae bacterium]|jgi:hypothetical protein|nr:hypothetical protein [Gemmatimonadaceae bacterium]